MNIVARVHLYPPEHCAGAEMMLHELLKAVVERGHRAQVWLSRNTRARARYDLDGIEIYPNRSGDWLEAANKADLLITHLDNTAPVVSAAIALRKPLVQVLHNSLAPTRMWANCKADLLVANAEWMADHLGRPDNMIVIRPPVRVADYNAGLGTPGRKVTLVNLNQAKGGLLFAQLAALLPHIEFLGIDGAYGEQLHPAGDNVTIMSHGQDMNAVYADTALLLMPSEYESWGRVGIEAMCSGIPVLACPTPGLLESLGDAGIFIDRNDLYRWAQWIDALFNNAEAYQTASQAAYERACELDPTDDLARWAEAVENLTREDP